MDEGIERSSGRVLGYLPRDANVVAAALVVWVSVWLSTTDQNRDLPGGGGFSWPFTPLCWLLALVLGVRALRRGLVLHDAGIVVRGLIRTTRLPWEIAQTDADDWGLYIKAPSGWHRLVPYCFDGRDDPAAQRLHDLVLSRSRPARAHSNARVRAMPRTMGVWYCLAAGLALAGLNLIQNARDQRADDDHSAAVLETLQETVDSERRVGAVTVGFGAAAAMVGFVRGVVQRPRAYARLGRGAVALPPTTPPLLLLRVSRMPIDGQGPSDPSRRGG